LSDSEKKLKRGKGGIIQTNETKYAYLLVKLCNFDMQYIL